MVDVSNPVRILVVDDEPSVRLLLRSWIERSLDAEVREAQDGLQALEMVAEGGIEILVSDINMPVLDGIDMLSLLQADPAREPMEMLIVSQVASEEKVQQVIALGVSDYLLKPLQHDWAIQRLQAASERVRARRENARPRPELPRTAVLVADPDPNFCAFAESTLSSGYHVETARSIADALVKTLRGRPDIVLLSSDLPGLSVDFVLDRIGAITKSNAPKVYLLGEPDGVAQSPKLSGRMARTFVPESLRQSLASALGEGETPESGIAAWGGFLGAELISATRQTFGMMTGAEPEALPAETADPKPPPDPLYGSIDIHSQSGDFSMRVDLRCRLSLAAALMAGMLGEEPPPDHEPPLDALREVLNVVAGRIKNACVERRIPVSIGLPNVGSEPLAAYPRAQLTIARRFRWSDQELTIALRGRPEQEAQNGSP